ncbi:hypothetical protein BH23ACT5_BH23ACT5_20930 [soil metagenome]
MLEISELGDSDLNTRLVCVQCGAMARSHTPFGFMCHGHAIREMLEANERGEQDWIPFSLAPRA